MPISTRGRSSNAPRRAAWSQSGFTLLEIMVVVVIIAILTTLGVLSIGVLGGDRAREGEVERFEDVVATAIQEAELEGRDFGVRVQRSSYEVYVYSPRRQRWETVQDDKLYGVHVLPPGLQFSLNLDGRVVRLDDEPPAASSRLDAATELQAATDSSAQAIRPQLVFFAGGDVSPYHLELIRDDDTAKPYTLDQAADGTLKARAPGQTDVP